MVRRMLGGLAAFLFLCSSMAAQDPEPPSPPDSAAAKSQSESPQPKPPTAAEIGQWVSQLSADQYYVRDAATRKLINAGRAAVAAVTKALDSRDLEVTTRGIFVLQRLALVGDAETEEEARLALEKLAAVRVTAAARRATDALHTLQRLKQEQALKQLANSGAVIDPEHAEVGLSITKAVLSVEIGEQWRGQESDLRHLKWLQNVEQITLTGKQVTDRWVSYIRDMKNLTTVKIGKANISRDAIEHFKALPRLRYVKLLSLPIGDETVETLKQCTGIEIVLAFGTQLTLKGKEQLVAAGMTVDWRRGAFLGISVPSTNEGLDWFIDRVTANSAAAKAGLRSGDVIVKYGGRDVTDFASLRAMIADNYAGDKVTLHVRRDAEILVKEVTFGFWE